MTAAVGRRDEDDTPLESCELEGGDIILFEPGNGARFIRASPDCVIDLQEVWSR